MRPSLCVATAVVCALVTSASAQPAIMFKAASWNIRSGMGIKAFSGGFGPLFSSNTSNCTDPTRPMNAWGWGLPQQALTETLSGDPAVIALGLQEAWGCASPENVRRVLGWKYASGELNGTALLARHGIKGLLVTERIATRDVDATEDQYLFGADVCLDAGCTTTARIYTVHYAGADHAQIAIQIQNTIRAIDAQPLASVNVVAGDFNTYDTDLVPKPCATPPPESPGMVEWARSGYVDAWALLRPHEDGDTGMWNRNGCGTPNGGLFKRIDYIMTRGYAPVAVDRWAMINPGVEDAPSDHAGIVATLTTGAVSSVPPQPRSEIVIWPGSHATIAGSRWQVIRDLSAAGGMAILNPDLGDAKIITPSANPHSWVDVTFSADAQMSYRLWIRGKGASNHWANDSVLVQFSDAGDASGRPLFRIGTTSATWWSLEEFANQGLDGWGWQDNGYGSIDAPGATIQFATSGPHTVRLQQREDGIAIDQIVLSAVRYAAARPGAQRHDAVILSEER